MKKEIMLNVLKYTLGLILIFVVSSCSDDMIDLNNVAIEESSAITDAFGQKSAKSKMDIAAVNLVSATQNSITLEFTAGSTGMPAGFSLQWMKKSDFEIYGWNNSLIGISPSYCHASFSGNANASRYELGPNETTTVKIGDMLLDNGASTSCDTWLMCGETYVFRFFAHATKTLQRSDFSGTFEFSTFPCFNEDVCTYSQGWYKNHQSDWEYLIPNGLALGNITYTATELVTILSTPSTGGNSLLIVGHQLIATKLNSLRGVVNTPSIVADVIAADNWIGNRVLPAASEKNTNMNNLGNRLDVFIGGGVEGSPGHCQ